MTLALAPLFFVVSCATAVISATVGMAGGTVLLSFLALFYGYRELIPLHAAVQLGSNASRAWLLRGHVDYGVFRWFAAGSVVGTAIGTYFVDRIVDDTGPSILIALYILYELLKPKRLPSVRVAGRGFFPVGVGIGALSMFIGATGLLLGVFMLGDGKRTKNELIATQAAMQTLNHALKLVGFVWIGWRMAGQETAFAVLLAGAVVGTKFGVKLLDRLPAKYFFWVFRLVLAASAAKILISAALEYARPFAA